MPAKPRLTITNFALIRTPDEAAALVAGGCGCPGEAATIQRETLALAPVSDTPAPGNAQWSGTIVVEDQITGDGRLISGNALRWENLPIPLRYAGEDVGGHDGAEVVGRILTIERAADGSIKATGDFDGGSEVGREAARQVEGGLTTGVSVDLDSVSFEVRVAKELLAEMPVAEPGEDDEEAPEQEAEAADEEGRVKVFEMGSEDEVMVITDARIRAATIVAIPAFEGARITLDSAADSADEETDDDTAEEVPDETDAEEPALAIVAGSAPIDPPAVWFSRPTFTEPTPLTITPEGRIYGHLAVWGTCHTAYTGQCVEPPHSPSDYSYFRTGSVLTAEGSEIAVGSITLDTLHAGGSLSAAQTTAHYEHTGRGVADVTAGEDTFGVWIAGALRPGLDDEKVRTLRASPLSGDWRRIGGNLELVAALAVNVPGFPVPRPKGLVASGVMQSLVASGMLAPRKVIAPGQPGSLTVEDLRYLKRLAAREARLDAEAQVGIQSSADALAARIRSTRAAVLARKAGVTLTPPSTKE